MVKISIPSAHKLLSGLDSDFLARLLETFTDLSLVIDPAGRIVALSARDEGLRRELDEAWQGHLLTETLTEDSRAKLADLGESAPAQIVADAWRDLVHRLPDGGELPMRYWLATLDGQAGVVAMGHDMRAVAVLQQQVLNAQLALEQDYWRLRQLETRYRLLFRMTGDAVLVVDEATGKVLEANPTADKLLAEADKTVVGRAFPAGFDKAGTTEVRALLAEARAVGHGQSDKVRLVRDAEPVSVAVHFLRQDNEARFLVRLAGSQAGGALEQGGRQPEVARLLERAPDAVAVTDEDGRILAVNQTFCDLAQIANRDQAAGASIDRWLGRTGVDLGVLLNNLRQRDTVRLFATTLRGEVGLSTDVEISANRFTERDQVLFAFFIRDIGRRVSAEDPNARRLPRSVAQITEKVGRVPLKELVRESTDVIEKLCIETALQITGDNRASAAELLGLSRQSLYAKLHRYELAESAVRDDS
jgi:transcriptional regulator PpsR